MSNRLKYTAIFQVLDGNVPRINEGLEYQINNVVDLHNGTRYVIPNTDSVEIVLSDSANCILITSDNPVKVTTDSNDVTTPVQFSVDTATNRLTTASDVFSYTSQPITLTSGDTLPAPLQTNTTYYAIGYSRNELLLATSVANAQSGTSIDITDTGTGTHTLNREDTYTRSIDEQAQSTQILLTSVNAKRITIRNTSGNQAVVKFYAYRTAN